MNQNSTHTNAPDGSVAAGIVARVRAFEVSTKGFSSTGIVAAQSAAKARYVCWVSANDVGYGVKFGDIKVRRIPEFDNWATRYENGTCWGRTFVEMDVKAVGG
jgi:hypothetical protein